MIRTNGLTKRFGSTLAVAGLDLHVAEGEIFGFIGPNGAGKTTTIRMLATLLRPDSGDCFLAGFSAKQEGGEVRRNIGYMPDSFGVYGDMLVIEYLEFFAAAYSIRGEKRKQAINDILELTDLTGKRMELAGALSRGMQQRLGLARVLVHDPKVLLLDEPASGLDPRARVEVRELLRELGKMGKTILVSSHILHELSEVCTSVGIIEKGKLLYAGPVEGILSQEGKATYIVGFPDEEERGKAELFLHTLDGVDVIPAAEGCDVTLSVDLSAVEAWEISRRLVKEDFRLGRFEEKRADLEEAFIRITKGEVS
ncbi:MAG: ABC transporter ATP-binding protein [Planctomycetota bacterium]|jgi:ABC-2 type transport system ATP-binding protein